MFSNSVTVLYCIPRVWKIRSYKNNIIYWDNSLESLKWTVSWEMSIVSFSYPERRTLFVCAISSWNNTFNNEVHPNVWVHIPLVIILWYSDWLHNTSPLEVVFCSQLYSTFAQVVLCSLSDYQRLWEVVILWTHGTSTWGADRWS